MTILITGGSGLIGTEITRQLDEEVIIFDVDPPAAPPAGSISVEGDILDPGTLEAAVDTYDIDQVIHLAAIIGQATDQYPSEATKVNAVGTDNVFSVASDLGVDRVVWASTYSVYGGPAQYPEDVPLTEDVRPAAAFSDFPEAAYYYAGLKQLNEFQARLYAVKGLETYAVRPSSVFGPDRHRGWKGEIIENALMGEGHIPHPPDALINFVYVADVADLFVRLVSGDPSHRVYNTGGHTLTIQDIADTIAAETGGTVTCDPDGGSLAFPAKCDYDRARRDLDYELTPFADCVRDYIDRIN